MELSRSNWAKSIEICRNLSYGLTISIRLSKATIVPLNFRHFGHNAQFQRHFYCFFKVCTDLKFKRWKCRFAYRINMISSFARVSFRARLFCFAYEWCQPTKSQAQKSPWTRSARIWAVERRIVRRLVVRSSVRSFVRSFVVRSFVELRPASPQKEEGRIRKKRKIGLFGRPSVHSFPPSDSVKSTLELSRTKSGGTRCDITLREVMAGRGRDELRTIKSPSTPYKTWTAYNKQRLERRSDAKSKSKRRASCNNQQFLYIFVNEHLFQTKKVARDSGRDSFSENCEKALWLPGERMTSFSLVPVSLRKWTVTQSRTPTKGPKISFKC